MAVSIASKEGKDKAERKEIEPLRSGAAQLGELAFNTWYCPVASGIEPDQLDLHPNFWNALATDVRACDEITVIPDDRAWIAKYVVVRAEVGQAAVRLAYAVKGAPLIAAGAPKPIPEGYAIKASGPKQQPGFIPYRLSDGHELLNSGLPYHTWQAAYDGLLGLAIFRTDQPTTYSR